MTLPCGCCFSLRRSNARRARRPGRSSTSCPPLSEKITIEEVNFVLEGDKAKRYGVDRVPGDRVLEALDAEGHARDARIRFIGAPAGYEFISLVQAVLLVGGRASSLTEENRQRVMAVEQAGSHAGVHHADVTALSAGGQPRTRDGVPEPEHHGRSR